MILSAFLEYPASLRERKKLSIFKWQTFYHLDINLFCPDTIQFYRSFLLKHQQHKTHLNLTGRKGPLFPSAIHPRPLPRKCLPLAARPLPLLCVQVAPPLEWREERRGMRRGSRRPRVGGEAARDGTAFASTSLLSENADLDWQVQFSTNFKEWEKA